MFRRLVLALVVALVLSCKEEDEPASWGEVCQHGSYPAGSSLAGEGGCDKALGCYDRDDDPRGGQPGFCVQSCNGPDDCDTLNANEAVEVCLYGECAVMCATDSDCQLEEFAFPMVCDKMLNNDGGLPEGYGYCVIHRAE